jgi:hypothetical protein
MPMHVTGREKNNSKHVIMGKTNTAHVFGNDRTILRCTGGWCSKEQYCKCDLRKMEQCSICD